MKTMIDLQANVALNGQTATRGDLGLPWGGGLGDQHT